MCEWPASNRRAPRRAPPTPTRTKRSETSASPMCQTETRRCGRRSRQVFSGCRVGPGRRHRYRRPARAHPPASHRACGLPARAQRRVGRIRQGAHAVFVTPRPYLQPFTNTRQRLRTDVQHQLAPAASDAIAEEVEGLPPRIDNAGLVRVEHEAQPAHRLLQPVNCRVGGCRVSSTKSSQYRMRRPSRSPFSVRFRTLQSSRCR